MNAQTLADLFYTAENGNVCITADNPHTETVKAMVFAADQAGLGWDFAYEAVCKALQFLADADVDEALTADRIQEQATEFADTYTDAYTADLVKWLASAPLAHVALCDEAMNDYGNTSFDGTEQLLRLGQFHAYELAMQAVADNWPEDEGEEEEGAKA